MPTQCPVNCNAIENFVTTGLAITSFYVSLTISRHNLPARYGRLYIYNITLEIEVIAWGLLVPNVLQGQICNEFMQWNREHLTMMGTTEFQSTDLENFGCHWRVRLRRNHRLKQSDVNKPTILLLVYPSLGDQKGICSWPIYVRWPNIFSPWLIISGKGNPLNYYYFGFLLIYKQLFGK